MKPKEESPELREQFRSSNFVQISECERCKCTKLLSKRQRKVFDLLLSGKHTVTQMTIKTGYSDIRSYIKEIRDKNIPVQDEWVQKDDIRYKRYWIPAEPPHTDIENVKSVGEVVQENFIDLFEKRREYD
ncbi:hypothetical protein DSECCO2_146820 [anaerobic digester metagenome]